MHREKKLALPFATIALVAVSLTSGCSSKPNDAQIITNIQSQMFADSQLKNANLQVASINGQVTLKGTLPNAAARYEAYKIATQASGVAKVIDQTVIDGDVAMANTSAPAAALTPAPTPAVQPKPAPAPQPKKPAPKPKVQKVSRDSQASSNSNMQSAQMRPDTNANSAPPPQDQQDQSLAPSAAPQQPDTQAAAPPPAAQPAPPPPPPPQPRQIQVPAGSTVTIRMIDSIDSSVNKAGEVFHASLDAPIVVGDDVVVPKGADIYVRLAAASSAGKISGQSELHLELVKLELRGQSYPLVSTTVSQSGESRGKDTAKKVGGGAVLGAIIGAIAGGGKGAAIGAAAGGGAGGVYQGVTHGQQVKIPSETKLDFQLDQPVTVSVAPRQNS
jgi:hypothetical protein